MSTTIPSSTLLLYESMRRNGMTKEQADYALEQHLRSVMTHVQEWKYICEQCDDTGLEILNCPDVRCQRRAEHGPHTYGVPCRCRKGDRWRDRPQTPDDDLTAAANMPKRMTRMGR